MVTGSELSIHCQRCSFSHLCLSISLNQTELPDADVNVTIACYSLYSNSDININSTFRLIIFQLSCAFIPPRLSKVCFILG